MIYDPLEPVIKLIDELTSYELKEMFEPKRIKVHYQPSSENWTFVWITTSDGRKQMAVF